MPATPTIRASSVGASTGTGLTASHTIPAAVAVDDIMVCSVRTAANTGTISTPTNWTLIQGPSRSTSAFSMATWWKRAVSGDTGGAATVSSDLQSSVAWVMQFQSYAGAVRPDTSSAFIDNTSNTTVQATAVTTNWANELLVWSTAGATTGNTYTPPTGFAEQRDASGMTLATKEQVAAGASGSLDGTTSGNHRTITHVVPLRPVPDVIAGLVDTFTGTTIDSAKWGSGANSPATMTQNNQAIHTLAVLTAGYLETYITSAVPWNLVGGSALAELLQVPASNANVQWQYLLKRTDDESYAYVWIYDQGNLNVRIKNGGAETTPYTVTYNTTTHRWLRTRESAGTVYFDTSEDGTAWTNRHSQVVQAEARDWRVSFLAYTNASIASPGTAIEDNFNNPPAAVANSGYYRSRNRAA